MADDTDKPNKPKSSDENENLVKALESIKILLATSETKLSEARKSISQASAHSLKTTREVPVLEDVIVPGKQMESGKPAPAPDRASDNKAAVPQADLTTFKLELEAEMKRKLSAYAATLEEELKTKIREYLDRHSQ